MCSCCRQEMALAWTRQSGLACITPHPTRQLERRPDTAAPSPDKHNAQSFTQRLPDIDCFCALVRDGARTLQVGAQTGDEGVQAASQAVVDLGVGGWSRQQQSEHESEGRLSVGKKQTTGQVDHQRQTVERPGLDPAETQKIKVKTFSLVLNSLQSEAQIYQVYFLKQQQNST